MSAIESMMMGLLQNPPGPPGSGGLLGGPQMTPSAPPQMQMPQAAPLPPVVAPKQPSMFDRVKERLGGLLGLSMPSAMEYSGLLSPKEIEAARPSAMARFASITPGSQAPSEMYRSNLDRMVGIRQLASKMDEEKAAKANQAKIQAARERIGAKYALQGNETPKEKAEKLLSMAVELNAIGDIEGAKIASSTIPSLANVLGDPRAATPDEPQIVKVKGPNGKTMVQGRTRDGKVVWESEAPPEIVPPAGITYVTGTDPTTGQPTIFAGTTRGAPSLTNTGVPARETSAGFATMQKVIAGNKKQLSVIEDALKELDANPQSVGLKRGAGDLVPILGSVTDAFNQRADPAGVGARASIANIGSMIIHDRSGAAVTVAEMPRLRPFIPNVSDTPQAIRIKLGKLREAIELETRLYQEGVAKGAIKPPADNASPSTVPSYEDWKKSKGGE